MKTIYPRLIPEWIPYNNLQNIEYLTKGGFSEIYAAIWINGNFVEWDSEGQQLKRYGAHHVVLKRLENVENANQNWIEEAKSHLNISNKWSEIVQCFGLTQDPSNGNYMLVMNNLDLDLRKYLQQNHNQLTWKERIQIITDITLALRRIHEENAIHRDLHSGNILYNLGNAFYISDLGFCGPADKPLKISSKRLSNIFKRSSNTQNDYKIGAMQQQIMNHHLKDNEDDDTYNNPNLHSEEQDELELPD
ncbi:unnamed protein product [Rhizophagus irregularis]|nr:unnamed protein product [Rhizophagus irregularis]